MSAEDLHTVLGPGDLSISLDTFGRQLPPTCGFITAEQAPQADSVQRHEVIPLQNREPYERAIVNDYSFGDAAGATAEFDRRRSDYETCETLELDGLQLTSEGVIGMELGDGAFVFTATADTLKWAYTGAGSDDHSLTLDQPARVCWVHVLAGDRLAVIDVAGTQQQATIERCQALAEAAAARLD